MRHHGTRPKAYLIDSDTLFHWMLGLDGILSREDLEVGGNVYVPFTAWYEIERRSKAYARELNDPLQVGRHFEHMEHIVAEFRTEGVVTLCPEDFVNHHERDPLKRSLASRYWLEIVTKDLPDPFATLGHAWMVTFADLLVYDRWDVVLISEEPRIYSRFRDCGYLSEVTIIGAAGSPS